MIRYIVLSNGESFICKCNDDDSGILYVKECVSFKDGEPSQYREIIKFNEYVSIYDKDILIITEDIDSKILTMYTNFVYGKLIKH